MTLSPGGGVLPDLDLVVFFVVGLLGGAHCVGMCGPLVTAYSDAMRSGRRDALTLREVRQHAVFNVGRATSYAVIGGLFGVVGALALGPATLGGFDVVRGVLGVVVGLLILAFGVHYLSGNLTDVVGRVSGVGVVFTRVHGVIAGRVNAWANGPGVFGLGALHGLLPCPILYPAYLYVLVQASPARGALSLAVLGLGTVPAVFLFGTLVGSVGTTARVHLHRVLGAALVVMAYIPLSHGLAILGVDLPGLDVPFYQPIGGDHH